MRIVPHPVFHCNHCCLVIRASDVYYPGARDVQQHYEFDLAFDIPIKQAYRLRMFGAKYQWILATKFEDRWWSSGIETTSCSVDQILDSLDGVISTDIMILDSTPRKTIANLVRGI